MSLSPSHPPHTSQTWHCRNLYPGITNMPDKNKKQRTLRKPILPSQKTRKGWPSNRKPFLAVPPYSRQIPSTTTKIRTKIPNQSAFPTPHSFRGAKWGADLPPYSTSLPTEAISNTQIPPKTVSVRCIGQQSLPPLPYQVMIKLKLSPIQSVLHFSLTHLREAEALCPPGINDVVIGSMRQV